MPELDNTPLYNPQPTGNWPHLFNSGYVPILLHKLQKWRWHWFSYGKVTMMLLKFIWFQLIRGRSCWLCFKSYI